MCIIGTSTYGLNDMVTTYDVRGWTQTLISFRTLFNLILRFTGNVAYDKTATQGPARRWPHDADRAIDGSHDPYLIRRHCAYADNGNRQNPAWWQVDLGDNYVVISVKITNRIYWQCKLCRFWCSLTIEQFCCLSLSPCDTIQIKFTYILSKKNGKTYLKFHFGDELW